MQLCAGCLLDNCNTQHPICIPLPSGYLKGCIISRNPTSKFDVKEYKGNCQYDAPPKWLFERIRYFIELSSKENEILKNFLDFQCYWTHFHKCRTIKGNKEFQFRYPNGRQCADRWFGFDFNKYGIEHKIVILLGRDLQAHFRKEERAN